MMRTGRGDDPRTHGLRLRGTRLLPPLRAQRKENRMSSGETRQSLSRYTFCEVPKAEARALCLEHHYSGKWNEQFGIYNYGMRDHLGKLVGVAAYGHPMNPQSIGGVANVQSEQFAELNRLWIADEAGRNTETALMAYAHGELRRNTPVRIVQSFADGRLGVGTIYQAASFGYYGHHETMFHKCVATGEIFNGSILNNTARPTQMLRNVLFARDAMTTFEVDTYRYLKPLNRSYARRIRLEQKPYPKTRRGIRHIDGYTPPTNQIARAYALSLIHNSAAAKELAEYANRLGVGDPQIEHAITNKWIRDGAKANGIKLEHLRDSMRNSEHTVIGGALSILDELGDAA